MSISIGNSIVAIAFIIGVGVMIWQIMIANAPTDTDDVDNVEERLDESEEFLRRMERLSKRNQDENDKK